MIEIAVRESTYENIVSQEKKRSQPLKLYHVEVRFVSSSGARSICLQGQHFRERERAETDKAYVESAIKKTRARTKKHSKRS